nr:DUF5688 family protein [uncultured Acetatifactor sp.]
MKIMKEKIVNGVAAAVRKRFGKGYSVQFHEIVKGTGTVVPVVLICGPGATTGTAVQDGHLLPVLESGEACLQDVVHHTVRVYEELREISSCADIITKPDKNEILERVAYHFVDTERNAGWLPDVPHRKVLDLSAVYRASVKDDGIEACSIFVDRAMCARLGISGDELKDAADSDMEFRGFSCWPLSSVFPEGLDGMDDGPGCLWVVRGCSGGDGATALLYPYYFSRLARRLGGDVYMALPSRHELIVTSAKDGVAPEELRSIADRINSIRYTPEEMLTQNVYRYDREKKRLEIAGA